MEKDNLKNKVKILSKYKVSIFLIIIVILQTLLYIKCGIDKSYIHMDEAYSLGLASYNKTEIQNNEDFYNVWHDNKYYEDYLTVNDNEIHNYTQVYENQKNDVHPPLYYLILRFAMGFNLNSFSKWPGIIINIIIYAFVTIFMYLIVSKIFEKEESSKNIVLFITLISSITLSSITNVLYIRMYALSTLNIIVTTYLHLKLLDSDKKDYKLLICIGLSALIGSLTHYYYLFYLAMIFIMFVVKYIKEKKYKKLVNYIIAMCFAGISSLIIFPYSIQHLFFGYRGQGALNNFKKISNFFNSIIIYISKINTYGFNNLLFFIVIAIIGIIFYKKIKKIPKIKLSENKYIYYILYPTIFYFILVAISSPWQELRYVLPICEMVFILVIFLVYKLLKNIMKKEYVNKIIIGICLMIFVIPILSTMKFKLEPEVMYSDKKEIVENLSNNLNLPTIYCFNSNSNRFLDDILLFSKINKSYIAKDIEYNKNNIKSIINGKDISNGIIIFINEGQDNEKILNILQNALNLNEITHLKKLNACDVYYII